jgi:hypothetical protein
MFDKFNGYKKIVTVITMFFSMILPTKYLQLFNDVCYFMIAYFFKWDFI